MQAVLFGLKMQAVLFGLKMQAVLFGLKMQAVLFEHLNRASFIILYNEPTNAQLIDKLF
jgi:hypothetical protein